MSPSVRTVPGVAGKAVPAGGRPEGQRASRPGRAPAERAPYALGAYRGRGVATLRPGRYAGPGIARHRAPRRVRLPLLVLAILGAGALGTNLLLSTPRLLPWSTAPAAVRLHEPGSRSGEPGFDGPLRQGAPQPGEAPAGRLPGLGPRTLSQIPAGTRQALVVTGERANSWRSTATLWSRADDGTWRQGPTWPAHNALRGWTADHHEGDLHSPIGVFTLTAAGGLKPDPGTRLPYDRSSAFRAVGAGFEGEPLTGSFNYVVAIDYNHVPGASPLDGRTPLGADRGSGLWIHVDHQGPTHGCVALSRRHMVELLRALDPADHPVIVMGDRDALRA